MLKIEVGKGGIEKALKLYKSKVICTQQLKDLKDNQYYEKTSAKKRKQKLKAMYIDLKFNSNQN
jgi:ribosomal protein S21